MVQELSTWIWMGKENLCQHSIGGETAKKILHSSHPQGRFPHKNHVNGRAGQIGRMGKEQKATSPSARTSHLDKEDSNGIKDCFY